MTKLQRAKRQTRKKFREILRVLPKMTKAEFRAAITAGGNCGFCCEWNPYSDENCFIPNANPHRCPVFSICEKLLAEKDVVLDKRYWCRPAAELCRWVLAEIDKVKEA